MPLPAPSATPGVETLLPDIPVLRARITARLLEDCRLPEHKGALLRGGFGYAFQRHTCPQRCWGRSEQCASPAPCAFRQVFDPRPPPGHAHLHDLQDAPRSFVVEPPLDGRRDYAAGDVIEFGLVLIGGGIQFLPHFVFGFDELCRAGLARAYGRARLERVEALEPFRPVGQVVYQDGQPMVATTPPTMSLRELGARAAELPADLRITLRTRLRVKSRGAFIEALDLPAIVQSACWRLDALAAFYGAGPWDVAYRPLVEAARAVGVEQARVRWEEWERTSTRGPEPRSMKLGGIVGGAVLRDVPPELRAILLAAGVVHVGKACVFGHGLIELRPLMVAREVG